MVSLLMLATAAAMAPVTEPVWVRRPSGEDIALAYPAGAMRAGIEGAATLDCIATEGGTLTNCGLVTETPDGMGFGAATLKLSARFLMKPRDQQGQPVAGRPFKLVARFVLPPRMVRALPKLEVRRPGMPTGHITLNCRVSPEADLEDCRVVGPSRGLEAAAFELVAALNAASPAPADRGPGLGRVELPIAFTK